MNTQKIFALILVLALIMTPKRYAQDPDFHIFICFGQSNMEGSAEIENQDSAFDSRFQVLQSVDCSNLERKIGKWYSAIPPLSHCWAGLSPADYFGRTMIENLPDNIKVGVINIAIGGCDIRIFDKDIYRDYDSTYKEDWFVEKVKAYNGNPYKRLVEMAKIAQKSGVIRGMLLHQGETNTNDEKWPFYVNKIYNDILSDLSLKSENVPLLAGEVVGGDQNGVCAPMNKIIAKLPGIIPTAHIISSSGCSAQSDNIHFNSEGVRELGKRYAETFLSLIKISERE